MIHIPHTEKCQGWVDFEVSINGGPYYWKGMFYVGKSAKTGKVFIWCKFFILGKFFIWFNYFTETPSTSPALVWFEKEDPYHMVALTLQYCIVHQVQLLAKLTTWLLSSLSSILYLKILILEGSPNI